MGDAAGFASREGAAARPSVRDRVLVVEDDPALRASYVGVLEDEGYVVAAVDTLPGVREALGRERPTVMVLDLTLHGDFATDLLRELAADESAPAVVIVSAFPLGSLVADRFSLEILKKPFDLGELVARVEVASREGRRPRLLAR